MYSYQLFLLPTCRPVTIGEGIYDKPEEFEDSEDHYSRVEEQIPPGMDVCVGGRGGVGIFITQSPMQHQLHPLLDVYHVYH